MPDAHRLEASHLIHTIEESGGMTGEAFMVEELRLVARHFGGLEHTIMAVHAHVVESATGRDACSCPAGDPP